MKNILLFVSFAIISLTSCSTNGEPLPEPSTIKGKWQREAMTGMGYDKEAIETISLSKDNSFSLIIQKTKQQESIPDGTVTGEYEIIEGEKIKMKTIFMSGYHYENMAIHRLGEELMQSFYKKGDFIIIGGVKYKKV